MMFVAMLSMCSGLFRLMRYHRIREIINSPNHHQIGFVFYGYWIKKMVACSVNKGKFCVFI